MNYRGLMPLVEDDISIGLEGLSDILQEISPLHRSHYKETEETYLDDPYDPDYARLCLLEQQGNYVVFTVRVNKELVGYVQYHVFRDLHTRQVYTGREDCFYIMPGFRGRGLAPKLLNFAEYGLRHLGCSYVGMTNKALVGGADIRSFLEKHGYRMVAEYFCKKL